MIGRLDFASPQKAVCEMVAAGAVFTMHRSANGLGTSFSYRVADGGDAQRCREVLASAKARPPAFMRAFRVAVQDALTSTDRGAA